MKTWLVAVKRSRHQPAPLSCHPQNTHALGGRVEAQAGAGSRAARWLDNPALNIAFFALLLSLPWEFGQMWLYAGASEMSHLQGIRICMAATVGDAVIMLMAYAAIAVRARSQDWVRRPRAAHVAGFVLIGLVVTIAAEVIATRSDGAFSWRYAPAMPVTPWLGIGLSPILMWLVVPLLVVWLVRRQIGRGPVLQAP